MTRILNFGSLNIDHVYAVPRLVRPGETLSSAGYSRFAGGKGNNQSVALARAGARVCHAGKIGADGLWLRDRLALAGVDTSFISTSEAPTGHAVIQVTPDGQNAIVLHGGANRTVTAEEAAAVLAHFGAGDYLLLQNEISAIPQIMRLADQRGLRIVFNPAPMEPAVLGYPLGAAACFVLNEVEGAGLTGRPDPRAMLEEMRRRFPAAMTVVTLGENGAMASSGDAVVAVEAVKVRAVDTTGAGDTFIGYFLAEIARDAPVDAALRTACAAAAICVTRRGAADSIPLRSEVEAAEEGKAEKKR